MNAASSNPPSATSFQVSFPSPQRASIVGRKSAVTNDFKVTVVAKFVCL
jgi:hypothetical protein